MQVIALCRNCEKAEKKFSEYLHRDDFQLLIQDVTEEISDAYRADIIVHAASPASLWAIANNPSAIIDANIKGYMNILDCARRWGVERIVQYSSITVYGNETPDNGADETYRGAINFEDIGNCYCLSKQMCEMMGQIYVKQYGMDVVVIRPSNIIGPGQGASQQKSITDFMRNYLLDENIVLKSIGGVVRNFCYLADATKAFFYILLKGEKGEAYNVSSDRCICTVKELAEVFLELGKDISIEYDIPENSDSYLTTRNTKSVSSSAKLQSLGWKDSTSLKEGVGRSICWVKDSDFFGV